MRANLLILCSFFGWGGALLSAKTPAEELIEVEERYAQNESERADSIVRRILGNRDAGIDLWKKAIETQVKAGRVVDAANNAEAIMLRSKGSTLNAECKATYEGVMRQMEAELDRFLAFQSWAQVDRSFEWFRGDLAKMMRRMVREDLAKTRKVLVRACELLQMSPEEVNRKREKRPRGQYSDFLAQLGNTPELANDVFNLAEKEGLTRDSNWISSYQDSILNPESWRDEAHVRALFSTTPFVEDAGEFKDLFLGDSTLIGAMLNRLRWAEDRTLKGVVLRDLEARNPQTFGAELVGAMLVEDGQGTVMKAFLSRRKPDLRRLGNHSAAVVVALIASKFKQLAVPAPLPPDWVDCMKPLLESEDKYLEVLQVPWRESALADILKQGDDAALKEASWIFRRLVCRDRDRAMLFLEQATKIARANPTAFGTEFAAGLMRNAASIPETLPAVMKIAEKEIPTGEGAGRSKLVSAGLNYSELMRDPQRLVAYLDAAGLLGDVKQFTSGWEIDEPFDNGVVKKLVALLPSNKESATGVCKLLAQRQPRTFGTEVILMLLVPSGDLALPQVVGEYRSEISSLPADLQIEMARFCSLFCRDLNGLALVLPNAAEMLKARQAGIQSAAAEATTKILDAQNAEQFFREAEGGYPGMRQLASEPTASMRQTARALAVVADVDPKRAETAFKKYSEMLVAADPMKVPQNQRLNFSPSGPWLAACLGEPRLLRWVNERARDYSRSENFFWNKVVEDTLFPERAFASPRSALLLAKNHDLLVPAAEYAPLVWGSRLNSLQAVTSRLRGQSFGMRQELGKLLQSRGQLNFGESLIVAACQQGRKEAMDMIQTRGAEMAVLSPPVRQLVQEVFATLFSGGMMSGPPPSSMPAPLAAAGLPGETVTAEPVENLLKAGDLAAAIKELDGLLPGVTSKPPQAVHLAAAFQMNATGNPTKIEALLKQPDHVRTAGLILAKLQSEHDGSYGVPGPVVVSLIGSGLQEAWMRTGGLVEPAAATEEVLAAFATALKDVPLELQTLVYLEFLKRLPVYSRQAVLDWARECAPSAPQHAQARAMADAWLFREGLRKGEQAGSSPVWKQIDQFVNGTSATSRARFGVAAYWCREVPDAVPAAVVLPAARLGIQFWAKDQYFPESDVTGVLICFGVAAGGKDWDVVAQQFQLEWERRTFAMKNGRDRSNNTDAFHASIAILARMGRETDLDLMFETYKYSLAEELWPVVLMAQQGMNGAAASRLRGNWSVLTGVPLGSAKTPLLPLPSPEQVAAFVGAFRPEEKELALLGEQILLSGGVVRTLERTGAYRDSGEQRMAQLARRVAAMPVMDRRLRRVLHGRIVQATPELLGVLTAHIKDDAEDAVLDLDNYGPSRAAVWPVESLAMDAAAKVKAGDLAAISNQMQLIDDAMRRRTSLSSLMRESARGGYLFRILDCVAHEVPNLPEDRRRALLGQIVLELKKAETITSGSALQGVHWLMTWWLEGQGQDFSGLPEIRSHFRSQQNLVTRVRIVMQKMVGEGRNRLQQADRVKLMLAAMNRTEFQAEVTPQGSLSPALETLYFLLGPDEILQFGKELSSGCKAGGRRTYEMAMVALSEGKNEAALELLKLAENEPNVGPNGVFRFPPRSGMHKAPVFSTGPRPGVKMSWSTEWIFEGQVIVLLRLGRDQEAETVLNTVADAPFLAAMKPGLARIIAKRSKP